MKILHVVQGYTPAIGGTELLIQRVSEELVRQYHDQVTVFTTNCYGADAFHAPWLPVMPSGEEVINGVDVHRFGVARWQSIGFHAFSRGLRLVGIPVAEGLRVQAEGPLIPGFVKKLAAWNGDLIAASSFPLKHMFDAVKAAQRTGRACVLHGGIHPQDTWSFDRTMIDRAIKAAAHYIANTNYEAEYVISRGADPGRVTVIGVGVDPIPFHKADGTQIRERYGWGKDPVVGFIGQFAPHKGADTLLQAMQTVWDRVPEARLLMAGAKRKYANQLEGMIAGMDRQLRERITFLYDFPDELKPDLFTALDVFAYPSRFESFGIAFLEAWAAGKPVIGCRAGAVPDVISDGTDGLLVAPGNANELAEAITILLTDPAKAHRMGASGRTKTLDRYNWSGIARRFRSVYQQAIEKV
jgi:glycosyltransferase involved in cell wall biosynthesis